MKQQTLQQTNLAVNISSEFNSKESLVKNLNPKVQKVEFDKPIVSSKQESFYIIDTPKMNDQSQLINKMKVNFTRIEDKSNIRKRNLHHRDLSQDKDQSNPQNNIFNIFIRKRFIKTFISNLKRWSYIRQALSLYQQILLEEQYIMQDSTNQNKSNVLKLQNEFQQSPNSFTVSVFEPLSLLVFLWKTFSSFIQLIILWFMPFLLSFPIGSLRFIWDIEAIFLLVLILDSLVQLNSAYIDKGQVIRQRQNIYQHYFKYLALKDSLGLGSLCLIFFFPDKPWIIIFVIIYVYISTGKIAYTVNSVHEYFHFNGIMNETMSLTKLVIRVLLVSHICACLWHFVGQRSIVNGNNSWILEKNLANATIFSLYNQSFYWATMTMVTVGYGDVSPQNDLEVLVATITMYVTCAVFAYAINTIGNSLSNIEEQKVLTKKAFSQINQYMSSHQVCYELQGRVRNYLEYCFKQDRGVDYEDVEYIFEKLPLNIRQDLIKQIRRKALSQCKIINETFCQDVQNQLLPHMERVRFSPEQIIFKENAYDDSSIYMIQQGQVDLICNDKVLQTLQIGDSFGERSFLTSQIRCCEVKAIDFVKVYKLSQESILKVLLNYPAQREKWCHIRDQICLNEQYSGAKMSCYSCGQSNHLVIACPVLFYKPDKERIILQEQFPINQTRSKFNRTQYKQSSLMMNKQLQKYTRLFRIKTNKFETSIIEVDDDEDSEEVELIVDEDQELDQDEVQKVDEDVEQDEIQEVDQRDHNNNISEEGSENIQTNRQGLNQGFTTDQGQDGGSELLLSSIPSYSKAASPGKSVSKFKPSQFAKFFNKQQKQDENQAENEQMVIYKQEDIFQNETKQITPLLYDRENLAYQKQGIQIYHTLHLKKVPNIQNHYSQKKFRETQKNFNFIKTLSQLSGKSLQKDRQKQSNSPKSNRIQIQNQTQVNSIARKSLTQQDNQKIQLFNNSKLIQSNLVYAVRENERLNSSSRANQQSLLDSPLNRCQSKSISTKKQKTHAGTYLTQQNQSPKNRDHSILNMSAELSLCPQIQYMVLQIDSEQMQQYDIYFPHNNFDHVIKLSNKFMRSKSKIQESQYSLYFSVKKQFQKIRRLLNKQLNKA